MGCYLKGPTSCCKLGNQCCCCISHVAIPCDETMPCVAALCCLTLYPKFGCYKLYGEVENTGVCRCLSPSYKVAAAS